MNDQAVVGRLRGRGEVPPVSTDGRRSWLLALTEPELLAITRVHGADQDVFSECWGFGAYHAGADIDDQVKCSICARVAMPLWFLVDDELVARCWRCSALRHLTECDLWEVP